MSIEINIDKPIDSDREKLEQEIKRRQLPRDYARCDGVGFNPDGRGVIECDRRQSCKRFLSFNDVDSKYARYLIPEMTIEKPNCEEYIYIYICDE